MLPAPPREAPPPIRFERAAASLAVVLGGAFLILKSFAIAATPTDEFIYLYMGRRLAEGAIPYRDFFFAHPPLHLIPGAILTKLFGFSIGLARAIPSAAALAAGAAVYRIGRRAGPAEGLVSFSLFLLSYDLLRTSSHYTGAVEATAALAWSLERALAGRLVASGLLAAGAGLTAFYALPPATALGLFLLWTGGAWRSFAAAFLGGFLSVNALCCAVFGTAYWNPVIVYHFLKPEAADAHSGSEALVVAAENPWLFFGAVAAGALGLARGRSREPAWTSVALGLLASLAHLASLLLLRRVFVYYYVPAFPGLAIAAGIGLVDAVRAARPAPRPARSVGAWTRLAAALVLAAPVFVRPILAAAVSPFVPGYLGPQRYFWRDAPLPATLNDAIRMVFWRETPPTSWSSSVTRYLQHESLHFETPAHLAERLREVTGEQASIYGDSQTAPLVALLAGRRIALDEADTNLMRFRSGITSARDMVERLEVDPPEAVIVCPRRGFAHLPEMRAWLAAHYRLAETRLDPIHGPYLLYLRTALRGGGTS